MIFSCCPRGNCMIFMISWSFRQFRSQVLNEYSGFRYTWSTILKHTTLWYLRLKIWIQNWYWTRKYLPNFFEPKLYRGYVAKSIFTILKYTKLHRIFWQKITLHFLSSVLSVIPVPLPIIKSLTLVVLNLFIFVGPFPF